MVFHFHCGGYFFVIAIFKNSAYQNSIFAICSLRMLLDENPVIDFRYTHKKHRGHFPKTGRVLGGIRLSGLSFFGGVLFLCELRIQHLDLRQLLQSGFAKGSFCRLVQSVLLPVSLQKGFAVPSFPISSVHLTGLGIVDDVGFQSTGLQRGTCTAGMQWSNSPSSFPNTGSSRSPYAGRGQDILRFCLA